VYSLAVVFADHDDRGMNTHPSDLRADRWMSFAGVLFLIGATFNAVYGISALANDDYFASDELLFGDLSMWGALYLAVAAVELVVGLLILNQKRFGVWLGIVLVVVHATIALLSIAAYPIWTVIVLAVDGLIVYGLTVYGLED
jgi:hypothetical protein